MSKILKLRAVIDKTALSRSGIYRLMDAGKFPRQVKLSERSAGWFEADIEQWLADLPNNPGNIYKAAAKLLDGGV